MPAVDLIDETFIVASPRAVSAVAHDPQRWRTWWPDLELTVFMDRADHGIRWSVSGEFVGSNELWLEPVGDGTLVHYFLRVDLAAGVLAARPAARLRRTRTLAWKRWVNALKDELEGDRAPGSSPAESVPTKPE